MDDIDVTKIPERTLRMRANVEPCFMCEAKYQTINYKLPTFKGYTVDFRVRQFRKVHPDDFIEFVEFSDRKGLELIWEMHETTMEEE